VIPLYNNERNFDYICELIRIVTENNTTSLKIPLSLVVYNILFLEKNQVTKEDQEKIMKEYSHGMKNKMQLLIHIISNPKILLLDEPLTSFDIVVQDEMKKLLKQIKKEHILVFSTHILEIAMDLCDEIVIIHDKKLELIEKKNLNQKEYKNKIIQSLKDSSHV